MQIDFIYSCFYLAVSLSSLIKSPTLCVDSGFLHKVISSINNDSFISSSLIILHSISSFPTTQASSTGTMLNGDNDGGHLCPVSDLRTRFQHYTGKFCRVWS